MNIDNYFKCFSEEEFCAGAELLLSGETKTQIEPMADSDFDRLVFISGPDTDPTFILPAKDRFYKLSSSTAADAFSGTPTPASYQAALCFDSMTEKILSSDCNCPVFHKDHYGCPHIAAALTGFYMEKDPDFFKGTRLEETLKEISGAEDPFLPGVMKRTDPRLRGFLQANPENNDLPVWEEKESETIGVKPQLRCECTVLQVDSSRYLELKAGPQRTYIIKDIPSFLEAYRNKGIYTLGKEDYVLCEDNFTKESLPLLNMIIKIKELLSNISSPFISLGGSHDLRYMKLSDSEMSQLLEILDGTSLTFSDGSKIPVQLDRIGLELTLRKKNFGASVQANKVEVFSRMTGSIYLRDSRGIFRIHAYFEKQDMLRSLLASSNEAYIRESDIPVFLSKFLPFLEENTKLNIKGLHPDNYEKEVPEFLLYLDLEDQSTISCQPFSSYSDPDVRYPLFDSQTGTLRRNGPAEKEFAGCLINLFDTYEKTVGKLYVNRNEEELFEFLQKEVPNLQRKSTIFISDRLKRIKVRKLPPVSIELIRQASTLLMNIQTDAISKEEMHQVLSAYSLKKKYFRLKDGSFFDFEDTDSQVWSTLSDLYQHYGKKDPKLFSIPVFRTLYLDEMLSGRKDLVLKGDAHYKKILQAANENEDSAIEVPPSLNEVLRPYQKEGFFWIKRLKRMGFGGILADDMGLGKTLQVLSFLLSEKSPDSAPSLIVCPASLVYNWKKELERFTPQLSSVLIVGTQTERKQKIQESQDINVWITSYDLLKRDIAFYEDVAFSNEIIDEAQYIKNQSTQAAKSVRTIHAGFRLALTGTPIENRLSELWSIMDYLMPGFLYPYTRFQKEFEVPISLSKDSLALERLRRMVHPFILRRMKSDVLKELPAKQEETVSVRLEGEQSKIYSAYAGKLKLSLEKTSDKDFASAKIQVLAEITRLRQICCDPSLVVENYSGENAKLDVCMELISQAIESGHKLLLFSQFTTMLDIICARLTAEKLSYYRIDGSTRKEMRMEMVDSFASDDVPIFCISLKAGGTGLNLTAADIVIHYDPWWNQAAQNQATDRAHRIGQKNKVTVYELVARDTLEERIQEIKTSKTKLMEDVLSGDTISSTDFNRSELLRLL